MEKMFLKPTIKQISRGFHVSHISRKKYFDVVISKSEARQPIPIPSNMSIRIHRIPPSALSPKCPYGRFSYEELKNSKVALRRFAESSVYYRQIAECTAVVEIRGPAGVGYVPIPEWIDVSVSCVSSTDKDHNSEPTTTTAASVSVSEDSSDKGDGLVDVWHGQGAKGGKLDFSTRIYDIDEFMAPSEDTERFLHISCIDPLHPLQERHWGFYKRRIATFVRTTVTPHTLPIRMVGIGYRASMEDLKLNGPEKGDVRDVQNFVIRWQNQLARSPLRKYLASAFPDSLWGQVDRMKYILNHDLNKHFTIVFNQDTATSAVKSVPKLEKKISMKLGYSHNIDMIIPPFISAHIPTPTKVIVSSVYVDKLKEFACEMRKWRKPEPYKGKGIFVGSETITLKAKKVK